MTFAFKEIISFVGHCHVTFSFMEPLSFSGRFVQEVTVSCFSDSICQFLSQQKGASLEGSLRTGGKMAVMLQTKPSFYTKLSEKCLFVSAITYEKYIVCKDYCITHHDEKTCFLPACKNHILLIGNVEELLKKLDTFAKPINMWTVCTHYSSIDSVEK